MKKTTEKWRKCLRGKREVVGSILGAHTHTQKTLEKKLHEL